MENETQLQLKFWGVRGSIPTPSPENLGYGGNTTCLEIRHPGGLVLIDAGTGIRNAGMSLQREWGKQGGKIRLFLTHFHWDHIQGLPFFVPLYSPANDVTFLSATDTANLKEILEGQMSSPYFPVKFEFMAAKRNFENCGHRAVKENGLTIHPFPLNHPQGATGYRVEYGGKTIVHASDLEHGHPELDRVLRDHAQGADILVMDSQYTPEEYEAKKGWGHSTWKEATRVARECGVKQLVLFHHDPSHHDGFVAGVERDAQAEFEETIAAKEGWCAEL